MGGKALVSGRGRKPKPVARKKAAGNPGQRKLNDSEPTFPQIKNIDPPEWIGGFAREMWERIAPELCGQQILTMADIQNFEAFCDSYGRWREARDQLKVEGLIVFGASGQPMKNPLATIINEALKQMATFGSLLGLDPSSRQRLSGPKKADTNGFSGLL